MLGLTHVNLEEGLTRSKVAMVTMSRMPKPMQTGGLNVRQFSQELVYDHLV